MRSLSALRRNSYSASFLVAKLPDSSREANIIPGLIGAVASAFPSQDHFSDLSESLLDADFRVFVLAAVW